MFVKIFLIFIYMFYVQCLLFFVFLKFEEVEQIMFRLEDLTCEYQAVLEDLKNILVKCLIFNLCKTILFNFL